MNNNQFGGLKPGRNKVHRFHLFLLLRFAVFSVSREKEKLLKVLIFRSLLYFACCFRELGGSRTHNLLGRNQVLYPLSYESVVLSLKRCKDMYK